MQTEPGTTPDVDATGMSGEGLLLGANGITILRSVSWLMLLGGLALLASQLRMPALALRDFAPSSVTVLGGIAVSLLRAHKMQAALYTVLWGVLLVLLVNAFFVSGVRTPGLAALPFLILTSAWLISMRTATAMAVLSALTLAAIVVAEYAGYVPPSTPRSSLSIALIYLIILLGTLAVAQGSLRSFQNRLQQVEALSAHLGEQVEELRLSEERFAALFRANPVPSSTIDPDGHTIDVNDAWVALFDIPASQIRGKTAQALGLWTDPREQKRIQADLARQGRVNGVPVTLHTRTGARPFLMHIAPVEFGGKQRLVTSLLDQTDRHAAEAAQRSIHNELEARVAQRTEELSRTVEELKHAHKELVQSEKLASLGAMVAGISHELNTPIGNTLTVASTLQGRVGEIRQLLEQGTLKRSELTEFMELLQEMADLITRSTERAAELISSFKQVSVDRASERRRAFDVRKLAEDIVTSLRPGMRQSGVTISIDIPAGLVCDSYPGPAGQVLTNLIQNAVTHAFPESAPGHIAIRAEARDDVVVMTVHDNGKGMSENTQKHAFDPFFTTRMGQGGSGLGLSVSYRIATSMLGGSLSVASTPGEGSTFTFSFLRNAPLPA